MDTDIPHDILSFIVRLGLGAHPVVASAITFGTLLPAAASTPVSVVPVHSWTVTTEIDTAILLSADVSHYIGRAHHSWTFSLLLQPVASEIVVSDEPHNFVICIPADAIPTHDTRFSFVDGDILLFYVDESELLPLLRPVPTAHIIAVCDALKKSGFFLCGIEGLNCSACEDGEGILLVKYDIG